MVDPGLGSLVGGGVGCAVGVATWRITSRPPASFRTRPVAGVAAVAAVFVGLMFRVPMLASAGPVAIGFLAVEFERRERRARDRRRQAGLPIVVDAMIQQLRSGTGLRVVCATPVPVGPEVDDVLRPLVDLLGRQRPLREAVQELQVEASKRGWHDAQLFAATLAALVDRGGPAVPALQRLRLTLTGSVQARSRAAGQAGQARASAALLAGAPALFALIVALVDADVGHLYLREPLGAFCVTAALLLSQAGWHWMNREVDRALNRNEAVARRGREPRP
ncbi:MAG: hypothetical protein OES24_08255 [Acidimicrobiia bacterium]|nr:hypothetical protein [Acidimicrobiia bacterium]